MAEAKGSIRSAPALNSMTEGRALEVLNVEALPNTYDTAITGMQKNGRLGSFDPLSVSTAGAYLVRLKNTTNERCRLTGGSTLHNFHPPPTNETSFCKSVARAAAFAAICCFCVCCFCVCCFCVCCFCVCCFCVCCFCVCCFCVCCFCVCCFCKKERHKKAQKHENDSICRGTGSPARAPSCLWRIMLQISR